MGTVLHITKGFGPTLHVALYRSIVERLSVPGVRRLFVIDPDTRRMEGIVSLSDVAAYLFDVF